jgi:hypothetical protein
MMIHDGFSARSTDAATSDLALAHMVTLRIVRHDRQEQVLAECESSVVPARGEVVQLDTVDAGGEKTRPSTMWRVVSVTLHVPSLNSSRPADGSPLGVRRVEVSVLPDVTLVPEFEAAAAKILSESKM